MRPHRCKGWLNAKPQDPALFAQKTQEISRLYRIAPLLHSLGVHVISLDEMTGVQALERAPSDTTDETWVYRTARIRIYPSRHAQSDCRSERGIWKNRIVHHGADPR